MNTSVTEDVYTKPRPPPLKPPRLHMRCPVSEPVNQQVPPYLEMLQAEGSENIKEHAVNTDRRSSDVRSPPPLPLKHKTMLRTSGNTPCNPRSPKPLPRLPTEELYQTLRPLYASPQSSQSRIDSSETGNPTSVSTVETSTGSLTVQPTSQYQNIKEHAVNTDGRSSDVRSPPPLPLKHKTMLRTSGNTPCNPRSTKPLPRLPTEELYQTLRLQPITDDDYSRLRPPPPPPPLIEPPRPPMTRSVSEPVNPQMPPYLQILPAEGSQFRLPGTYQGDRTPNNSRTAPPLSTLPESANQASPEYQNTEELAGEDEWNKWQRSFEGHRIMSEWDPLPCLSPETESRCLSYKAVQMRTALCFFHSLMLSRGERLRSNIAELHSIADNLDMVQKSTRAMGITGGTTGVVGGVTAVVGLALAPVTMGASLIATAVGAGVAVAGTGLGAGAAIRKKKNNKVDRARLEKVVQEYQADITEVEKRLWFILAGMAQIHRSDVARLPGLDIEVAWVVRLVDKVYQENASLSSDTQNQVLNTGVLKGFALWLDFYFTGDDGQKVKKGLESKFGKKIRAMAQQLQEGLDHVYKMWDLFTQFSIRV